MVKSNIEHMNAQLLVKSMPGTICPKEGKPREYIDDMKAQSVAPTAYYLRLISEGSLVKCGLESEAETEVNE